MAVKIAGEQMSDDFRNLEMKARMSAELDAFGVLSRKLSEISRRDDAGRRMDLVNLRRELALRIGTIGTTAQDLFKLEASHPSENEFRQRLSSVRHAVAMPRPVGQRLPSTRPILITIAQPAAFVRVI